MHSEFVINQFARTTLEIFWHILSCNLLSVYTFPILCDHLHQISTSEYKIVFSQMGALDFSQGQIKLFKV